MGRVFLGESPGGRKVAVKVVHPHHAGDPDFRRRFAREVAVARQVGGFHTAAVVGADPDADPPWMATAYIPGPSLAEAVAEGGPLDEAGVRQLGAALAEGLAAIHECGLIHRDLKPGNVILADDGPRIIDFGIAKGADSTALTESSAVIGTLRYMSPEQLNGHELTPQSDIFALGMVLAFAATGHDPFRAPTIPAVITRILAGPPDLDPLSGDLRGIIAGCLAKDPGGRPGTGDLLRSFSAPGPQPHDPTVISASVPVPAAAPAPEAVPSPEPGLAEAGGPVHAAAREPSFESTVDVSPGVPPGRTDPSAAHAAAPRPASKPARGAPWRGMGLLAAGVAAVAAAVILALVNRPAPSLSAGATPPPTSSAAGTPTVSTPSTMAKLTAMLPDPGSSGVTSVAFGPGGTLAAGDTNGSTYLWDTTTKKITATLTDPTNRINGSVTSVAFGPGGTLAAGDTNNGSTYLWDTTTKKITGTLTDPTSNSSVASVAFGPGGTLAAGNPHGSTSLWDTFTGRLTATLFDPGSSGVTSVAFGPGGILAAGDANGSTYLWDTTTENITATLTGPASSLGVASVAFGPGGILAAGTSNGSTYLWDTITKKITASLPGPASGHVTSVAFGPGGILAVSEYTDSSDVGSIYLWSTATGKITATLPEPGTGIVYAITFGPERSLAAADDNGSVYLWRLSNL